MNRTPYYSEEISQTALAMLALVAVGKPFDKATVQSLRSLFLSPNDSRQNRVNLTIFSGKDDEDGSTEPPVIIPFASQTDNMNRYHNGYGALSFKNSVPARREINPHLRIFSPDFADYPDEEEECCVTANTPALKLYAE